MTSEGYPLRLARALLLLACFMFLGGCSTIRIGYNQLDTIAAWKVDEYFDLDARQKEEFRARFGRLHEWHRRQELPVYAALLTDVRGRVQKHITREDVLWITDSARTRYRAIIQYGADDAAALLMTVTPNQLEALQRQWNKDNRRFMREHRLDDSAEEQRHESTRRVVTRVRDWTDGLEVEQEEKVLLLARELPINEGLRHEDRLRRQREFLQLMTQRGDAKQFPVRLRHWLLNWEEGRSPEHERLWAQFTEKQADFYVAVDRLLTPRQRAAVMRRVQGYAEDFTHLARQPASGAAK